MSEFDPINKPKHYYYCEGRKYEPIDVILDWDLNFCLGQVVKYVSRAGRKDDILSDINKALYYLERAKTEIIGKLFEERLSEQKEKFTPEPDICKTCAHLDRDAEGKYWCTNIENVNVMQMDGFPTECEYYYKGEEPSNSIPHLCYNCEYGVAPDHEKAYATCTCPRATPISPYLYYEENICDFWKVGKPTKLPHRCSNCKYGSRPDKEVICTCPSKSGASIPFLYFAENNCDFWEAR